MARILRRRPNAGFFTGTIEKSADLVVPAISLYEVFKRVLQQRGIGKTIEDAKPFSMPLPLRIILKIPGLRNLPPRVMAFGVRRVKVEQTAELPAA